MLYPTLILILKDATLFTLLEILSRLVWGMLLKCCLHAADAKQEQSSRERWDLQPLLFPDGLQQHVHHHLLPALREQVWLPSRLPLQVLHAQLRGANIHATNNIPYLLFIASLNCFLVKITIETSWKWHITTFYSRCNFIPLIRNLNLTAQCGLF